RRRRMPAVRRPGWASPAGALCSVGQVDRVSPAVDGITLQLSSDGALVLFDRLHRCEDEDRVVPPEHHGQHESLRVGFSQLTRRTAR
ncbi:hypothetical protein, partial [Dactylosporangium sp. NPDC005555]|uniref:hypothetical protein n=1 Tax=Dactylosporangium sp. NPDC005555 TaxID=3154889 RepID=UPI0033AA1EB4